MRQYRESVDRARRVVLRAPGVSSRPQTGSLRPVDIRPAAFIFAPPVELKEECSCPTSSPILPTSTTRSLSQGKTVELIGQPAAYSGAADDDLVAQRIADQEARIEL
ncbi:hypothetical protein [Bradyrhizobium erythrophlei]|uniref:hypothetical protein n=1 Tax=Bradyrhizobium erythrophlei TaxID=1437360 RepID=UPI00155F5635|nr:hypothetical protein [Bradyrhizobium erythrophlei]